MKFPLTNGIFSCLGMMTTPGSKELVNWCRVFVRVNVAPGVKLVTGLIRLAFRVLICGGFADLVVLVLCWTLASWYAIEGSVQHVLGIGGKPPTRRP